MTLRVSCSWCHEMNDMPVNSTGAVIYCANCQHRADVLRDKCDCRKCAETARLFRIRDNERAAKED